MSRPTLYLVEYSENKEKMNKNNLISKILKIIQEESWV